MKIKDLPEAVGRITKQNQTVDVGPNEIKTQAAKFGNTVDKDGVPPTHKKKIKGKSTNVLFNLGLAEQKFQTMQREVILEHKLNEVDLAVQQFSTRNLINYIKKLGTEPMDMIIKKAIYKELQKRKVKIENKNKFTKMQIAVMEGGFSLEDLNEITAVTNIDPNQVEKEDFDDHIGHTKKVGKIKGYEIHTNESNPHFALKYHHFLVKDPESEGFLGELKLGAFQNYWVSEVWFTPEIQGKGLALPLYVFAIKKGYDLVSDREQSKGSQAIWKNLTKVPGIFVYAWNRKYDEFFQWDPDEDLDSEIYYRQEKMDKIEADYKAKLAELDDKFDADEIDQEEYNRQFALLKDQYKKAEDELSQVRRFSDVRLVAIDEKKSVKENLEEITRRNLLKGIGAAGVAAATGAKVNVAKAANSTSKFDPNTLQPGEKYYKIVIKLPEKQIVKYHRLTDFKDIHEVNKVYLDLVSKHGLGSHDLDVYRMTRSGKKKESLEENKINFTMPNFNFEWEEANRYEQYRKIGKEEWIKLAKTGKAVDVDNRMANDIENTDAGEEYRDDHWDGLVQAKRDRFAKALSSGQIELPIIARYSDGQLELISGNTRLTGMMRELGKAKAWVYDVPDEIADLEENFADGKTDSKSSPGRVKRAGASCKGSVTDLRKRAKKYSGEKAKMYHWCANMKSGRKKG